jgi:hypothetical protein
MVDAGGVDGEFAARRRSPRPQLLLSSGVRSSRTGSWLCDSLHWVERHQDLQTEPDLDPSRTGVDGSRQQRSQPALVCAACVRRAQGCPEPTARGSGAAPHDRTSAPGSKAAGSPHSIRRTREAADPIPGGTQRAFPPHTNTRSAAGRQSSFGFDCLEGDTQRPSRSVQLAAKRPRMRSGGFLPPPGTRSRPSTAVHHLGRDRAQLLPPPHQPAAFEDHAECWIGHGEWPSLGPSMAPVARMAKEWPLGHWRVTAFCVPFRGPQAKTWLLDLSELGLRRHKRFSDILQSGAR